MGHVLNKIKFVMVPVVFSTSVVGASASAASVVSAEAGALAAPTTSPPVVASAPAGQMVGPMKPSQASDSEKATVVSNPTKPPTVNQIQPQANPVVNTVPAQVSVPTNSAGSAPVAVIPPAPLVNVEPVVRPSPIAPMVLPSGRPNPAPMVAAVPVKVLYVSENQPVQIVDSQGRLLQVIYLRKSVHR